MNRRLLMTICVLFLIESSFSLLDKDVSNVNEIYGNEVGTDDLEKSILLLEESLASGALLAKYEKLYIGNPNLTTSFANNPENLNKNRYKEYLPYDKTRVVLSRPMNENYINANYINLTKPLGGNVTNGFIATQCPLPSTMTDFWQMVSESKSSLIVMLTSLVENGTVKCNQYWPSSNESLTFGNLKIKFIAEQMEDGYITRDFLLSDSNTGEERSITHMLYFDWPDDTIPNSMDKFLSFAKRVRGLQRKTKKPVIIHCSAGVGRTGTLILIETALQLMESKNPVYPLVIVKSMRDQRPNMILFFPQYEFACQAICSVYIEDRRNHALKNVFNWFHFFEASLKRSSQFNSKFGSKSQKNRRY